MSIANDFSAKNIAGFTVIRLLVSLVLISILVYLTIPSFQATANRNKLNQAERTIREALTTGYQLALANSTLANIKFSDNQIHITALNDNYFQKTLYLPSSIIISTTTKLNFLPNGTIDTGSGQIKLRSLDDTHQMRNIKYSVIGIITS